MTGHDLDLDAIRSVSENGNVRANRDQVRALCAEVDSLRAKLAAAEQERDLHRDHAARLKHIMDVDAGQIGAVAARADRAERALTAVRELHQPDVSWLKPEARDDPDYRDRSACIGCRAPGIGGFSYGQCPTRRILAAAEQDEPKREQS